MAQGSPVEEQQ
jgi:hypothetical protein